MSRLQEEWSRHREAADFVIAIVDLLALGLALNFLFDLRKITKSMSTRFIGPFPHNLDAITDLVGEAKRSIDVLWDAVDPGSYFDPQAHDRLFEVVLAKARRKPTKVAVTYLVWGGPKAISAASGSHGNDPDPQRAKKFCEFYRSKSGFITRLEETFQRIAKLGGAQGVIKIRPKGTPSQTVNVALQDVMDCLNTENPTPGTPVFEALQLCLHEWIEGQLVDAGATIITPAAVNPDLRPEIFFWIIDGREAVFVFPCPGRNALAFRTHDSKLVETLEGIFNSRR